MREQRVAGIRRLVDALNASRDESGEHVRAILKISPEEWDAWLAAHPRARNLFTFRALIDEASMQEEHEPQVSLALSQFVLRHVDRLEPAPELAMFLLFLRGDAWRVHASALRYAGDLSGALRAYETAAEVFRADPVALPELVAAERAAAFTRHQLGESGEPQRIIRASFEVFAAHNHTADLVRSLIFDGAIDFDEGRYEDARHAFTEAMRLAESLDDVVRIAALHTNLGHCAQLLGDREVAAHHLTRALHLYEQHGMIAARPRALWGIAQLAADEGFIDAAVAEMETIAVELLEIGVPLDAAVARLDALEILVMTGRNDRVAAAAADLVAMFTAGGMTREALRALAFVGERAAAGALSSEVVDDARSILRRLSQASSS
ncbi:MAG TPA: tetratricopeptide repeat protein [Thermoanaerobaculia bacterium]|nr:tetratricopeptide repeat protein [Thermoanaerobaculia bacterium]